MPAQPQPPNAWWNTPPQDCEILGREATEKLAEKFARHSDSPVPADAPGYCFRQASGGQGCLLVFAAIWLTITLQPVRAFWNGSNSDTTFLGLVISLAFPLVGLGMVFKWLASRYRKVWILLTPTAICRRESLGPFGRHQVFPLADVAGLLCRRENNKAEESWFPQPEALFVVRKDAREFRLLDAYRGSDSVEWLGELLHRRYALPIAGNLGLFDDLPEPDAPGKPDTPVVQDEPAPSRDPLPVDCPPPSNAWYAVVPAASAQYADLLFKHRVEHDPGAAGGDRDSFAVKARYPSPLYSLFCVIGCGVAIGTGHSFLKDYANGEIFLIDLFGVAGGCFFVLVGLYNLLSKTTFFFLPDRLLKSIRFFSHVRTKEYPRAKITGADCSKPKSNSLNWSLSLTMSNEDEIGLESMGGRDSLSWLKSVVEVWLQRTPRRGETTESAAAPADTPQSRVLLDPPEGVTRLSPAQLAALEKKLCAAGQPVLSPAAVAVEVKCPLLITILGGGFLLTWLCGWYASAPAMIGKIFREGLSGNIGTLLGVLFFGCIGLLPARLFGTFLFTGTVLVFEPGCLRVRRRYGVFSRARRFEHREISGVAWGDRVIGILTTVELFTEDGKRMTLLEDSEKSPRLRWLARVLREEIAPEDYDGERAGYLFPGCLQNLLMHQE